MSTASTAGDAGVELEFLEGSLTYAEKRATAALRAGEPGNQPGEALQQYLAADAEVESIRRRIRKLSMIERVVSLSAAEREANLELAAGAEAAVTNTDDHSTREVQSRPS